MFFSQCKLRGVRTCYIAPQKTILFSDHLVILFVNDLNVGRHREVSDDEGYACNMLEF